MDCVDFAGGETVFPLSVHRQSVEESKKHSGESDRQYGFETCYHCYATYCTMCVVAPLPLLSSKAAYGIVTVARGVRLQGPTPVLAAPSCRQ
jgi:hypothetical protein